VIGRISLEASVLKINNQTGIIFHLAIPTHDLDQAEEFYTRIIGAERARRYEDRVTLNFFGHQVVCHLDPDGCDNIPKIYPRHFGITFINTRLFEVLYEKVSHHPKSIFEDMSERFSDAPERHRNFILKDPSNNLLEFKCYDEPSSVY